MKNKFGEIVIPLACAKTLCFDGSELRIRDPQDVELIMWASAEIEEDPESVLQAVFGAAALPAHEICALLGKTIVEDGCWI
jgi:hypothetical protein